jgi:hypothetical protein
VCACEFLLHREFFDVILINVRHSIEVLQYHQTRKRLIYPYHLFLFFSLRTQVIALAMPVCATAAVLRALELACHAAAVVPSRASSLLITVQYLFCLRLVALTITFKKKLLKKVYPDIMEHTP